MINKKYSNQTKNEFCFVFKKIIKYVQQNILMSNFIFNKKGKIKKK